MPYIFQGKSFVKSSVIILLPLHYPYPLELKTLQTFVGPNFQSLLEQCLTLLLYIRTKKL